MPSCLAVIVAVPTLTPVTTPVAASTVATAGVSLQQSLTTLVRNWASGAFRNYGLRVMVNPLYPGYTPSLGTTYFQSLETHDAPDRRPQLLITFQ